MILAKKVEAADLRPSSINSRELCIFVEGGEVYIFEFSLVQMAYIAQQMFKAILERLKLG